MKRFSVLVCAYNASSRIEKTLKHLALLNYPADKLEIILVDNNSNDGTSDYANNVWRCFNTDIKLRVIQENKQGKSHAIRTGIFESIFEYIVICDDDNWLDTDYLKIANEVLTDQGNVGVLGGQGIPVTDADALPNWFYTCANGYAIGVQAMHSGDVTNRGYVWGAGSILNRKVLLEFYRAGCEHLLSRRGDKLTSGEDSEICKWFLIAGYRLWYDERLLFRHFLPSARLTLEYRERLISGLVEAEPVLSAYDKWLKGTNAGSQHNRPTFHLIKTIIRTLLGRKQVQSYDEQSVSALAEKLLKVSVLLRNNERAK
jgi:glycosyltransferase involved in cell wall biosynthesis